MSSNPLAPAIVLVHTREEGNLGATARAMANMGLSELVLVRPEVEIGPTARAFAVGAGEVLDSARRCDTLTEALTPYQRVIGTTSARARELPVKLTSPRGLSRRLLELPDDTAVAIVFGPEVSGLNNEQLSRCGLLVRVPCAPMQPTLNLAQAVLVVAYEIYLARLGTAHTTAERSDSATAGELEGLFEQLLPLLERIGFRRDDTFAGVVRDLRRLVARAEATSREVSILRGICRRAQRALEGR